MSGTQENQRSESAQSAIVPIGTAREIPLTQGKVAIVDAEDYERLSNHRWYASKNRKRFYAMRDTWVSGKKGPPIKMHREILGLVYGDGRIGDHINRDSLDNRRCNLREVTHSINNYNCNLKRSNKSGYRGVCWAPREKRWRATIKAEGRQTGCGYYMNPVDAALAYDSAAIKYYGQYAVLNFSQEAI